MGSDMKIQATKDFRASINGADYEGKKGRQLEAPDRAARHLMALGLAKAPSKKENEDDQH